MLYSIAMGQITTMCPLLRMYCPYAYLNRSLQADRHWQGVNCFTCNTHAFTRALRAEDAVSCQTGAKMQALRD